MKSFLCSMTLLFLLSCSGVSAQSYKSPVVEALIDKTLKQMIFVEGGSFMMGDPGQPFVDALGKDAWTQYFGSDRNVPVHRVTIDSFYMGAYEVPFADYDVYSNFSDTPLTNKSARRFDDVYSPQRPVGISWNGARNYCQWLGKQTGLPFALPTEAQWEYAARNRGKTVVFATNTGKIERGVNFPPSIRFPIEIGQFPPSPLGFYDLSGNASEWVKDWYAKDYYSHSPKKNPQGPETGSVKVLRGGGGVPDSTTVARGKGGKDLDEDIIGFTVRCVINTDKPLPTKK